MENNTALPQQPPPAVPLQNSNIPQQPSPAIPIQNNNLPQQPLPPKLEKPITNTKKFSLKILFIFLATAIVFGTAGYIIRGNYHLPMHQNNSTSLNSMNALSKQFQVKEINLDSTVQGYAPNITNYIGDAWGINFSDSGRVWVSSNESGDTIALNGKGQLIQTKVSGGGLPVPLVVSVPTAPEATSSGIENSGGSVPAPLTGMIFSKQRVFSGDEITVVSEQGTIAGWQPNSDSTSPLQAQIRVNNNTNGAVYKGVTYAKTDDKGWLLYVANFGQGRVDVFNSNYRPVQLQGFIDPTIPHGFAPFNIDNINNQIYVTYAKQSIDNQNDVAGLGNGYVDIFTTQGTFVKRLISGGPLNSPWGIAFTPNNFGNLSNYLLIGNFGDGYINVFDPHTGRYVGKVDDSSGKPLQIDGLWGLIFGTNNGAGKSNELFFSAGPSKESQGLFGTLQPLSQ
jgi:uncharacterized protein (TIGR03118 family)